MEFEANGRKRFGSVRRAIGAFRAKVSTATGHVPEAVAYARHEAGMVADRLPGTLGYVREGAQGTMTNLQTVPDSGLRLLAAVCLQTGNTLEELENDFKDSVDDYLATCKALNREPKKPFKGSFNIRIGQELHEKAAKKSAESGKSLNDYIKDVISKDIQSINL